MNSYIGPHIKAEGWSNWNNTENYKTTRYAEYKNYGPSASYTNRVSWLKQLNNAEVKRYTLANVLGAWNPGM
jgi:pectinesterase